jgi:hypothetical protein
MAPWNHFCTFKALQRLKLTLASPVHIFAFDLEGTLRLELLQLTKSAITTSFDLIELT